MFALTTSRDTGRQLTARPLQSASARGPDRPETGRLSPVIESLTNELHHLTLLTAVTASGVNAIGETRFSAWPEGLMSYATPDLSLLGSLRTLARHAPDGRHELYALDTFLLTRGEAVKDLRGYADEAAIMGEARAAVLHLHHVTRAWQHTCRKAVAALQELETSAFPELSELHHQNNSVLMGLLAGASNGFKPCIRDNQLVLPPLPQQRRWPRQSLLQNCVVTVAGKAFKAFVRDVSAGGFGLDRMPEVSAGQGISVKLSCGRLLTGTIAWYRDSSAGMIFSKHLTPTDPLICG